MRFVNKNVEHINIYVYISSINFISPFKMGLDYYSTYYVPSCKKGSTKYNYRHTLCTRLDETLLPL